MEVIETMNGDQYIWIADNGEYGQKYYNEIDNAPGNPAAMQRRLDKMVDAFNNAVHMLFK